MGGLVEKCPEAGTAPAGRNADRQEIGGARRRRAADYWRKNRDRPCFFPGCRPGADKIKSKTFL